MTNEEKALKILQRSRVGALLRVYATTPEEVSGQIETALVALEKLLEMKTEAGNIFARIDFLISADPDFDDHDCGESAERLREEVRSRFPHAPVHVYEIKKGDIYSMILNYGVANQLENRVSYSLILSHWAHEYITDKNVLEVIAPMYDRARVAGLAISEIHETIEKGRLANTFALWHNKSLLTVGGFDLRAGKKSKHEMTDEDHVKENDHSYNRAGCEEIIPLLRLVRFFGPCLAVVEPEHAAATHTEKFSPEWHKRHDAKLATKNIRQKYMADQTDMDLESLEGGIIKDEE